MFHPGEQNIPAVPGQAVQASIPVNPPQPPVQTAPQQPAAVKPPAPATVKQPEVAVSQNIMKPDVKRFQSNGLYTPAKDPFFMIKSSVQAEIQRAVKHSESEHVCIMVTGPSGSGKTSLARQVAAIYTKPFCEVQCGLMTEPTQWFGSQKFNPELGTYYQESQFVKGVETEGCIKLLDELNRVENPKVLNSLFWLLDNRGEAYVDDLQRNVKVAKGSIFFATLNEGVIFSGVDFLDTALRDRFYVVNMEFLPVDAEIKVICNKTGVGPDVATVLCRLADVIRRNPDFERKISTRQLIMAAKDIKLGASIKDGVEFAIANTFGEQKQPIMQALQAFIPEADARGGRIDVWNNWQ
jgi:nitric oxide reductase NorQ protein